MESIQTSFFQLPEKLQKRFIANAIDDSIKVLFPTKYLALCHVYAVLGSNVLSMIYQRNYRPVAGIGVEEDSRGRRLEMLDNSAFANKEGGAYHCWIESDDAGETELVDFIYKHNATYARAHGQMWRDANSQPFLWGPKTDLCLDVDLASLPARMPANMVWFKETEEGATWLQRQLAENNQEYLKLTVHTLKRLSLALDRVRTSSTK